MADPIFLANGYAGPDAFPAEDLAACFADVLRAHGDIALQYGPAEGLPSLRELIAGWLRADGAATVTADDVLIVPGTKQVLALLGRLLAGPGATFLTSTPTYMTALQIFASLGLAASGVPCDEQGLRTDLLEQRLADDTRRRPAFLYTMPDFSNPTAAVLAPQRRKHLAVLAERFDVPLVEDGAYRWLALEGDAGPPLRSFGAARQLLSVGSFSKILAPGLRIAWLVAAPELRARLQRFKWELGPSPLTQMAITTYFSRVPRDEHLARSVALYRAKRDVMLAALDDAMPAGVRWQVPRGGYYVWLEIDGVDTDVVCARGADAGVLAYPGSAFFPDDPPVPHRRHLRLNYAHETVERIDRGVRILADVVRQVRSAPADRGRVDALPVTADHSG